MKPTTYTLATTALLAFVALAATAAAAPPDNQGTIKVHDDAVVDPATRNDPHVSCDFWIEGFNMEDSSGGLTFYAWPPTGNKSVVLQSPWMGAAEADQSGGFHFLAGPFNLSDGHYRVEAFSNGGHPGDEDHFAKEKTFWVDPCQPVCTVDCNPCEVDCNPCVTDCIPPPACPTGLTATPQPDGSVLLSFTPTPGSDATVVSRAVGDGDLEYLATVEAGNTTYLDSATAVGTSYTYSVDAVEGNLASHDCPTVTATSVPFFGNPAAILAGLAGVLGAVALVVRRKR